ncbi:MAG: HAMP domain-containing protein [Actinobacteria bacterium]|nr:HAMP domain-containing protein [Actinomycetota bacterium]
MTRRLVLSYLVVTIIVLAVLEIPLGIVYQQREQDRLVADVERDATVMAGLYEDVLETGTDADPALADEYTATTGARVVIVDAYGISVVDTDPAIAVDRDFSTRTEFAAALVGSRASGTRHSTTLATDLLYVAVPVASGGDVWGAVRITLDAHEVDERVQRFWLGLVGMALVVLAAMTGIGFAIARSVTRPIRRLQQAAGRFSRGDLTAIAPNDSAPLELRELQLALNTMAGRLEDMLLQQRSFVADASHQLRTPLTAIRLRLENLHSSLEVPGLRAEVDASLIEVTRVAVLVDDLLHLARAERHPDPVATDLGSAAHERIETWTAVAEQADVGLRFTGPTGDVWVRCVPGGIEQVLDNLLDNSITASPAGGTITVSVASGSGSHQLEVRDEGPGLSDEQKERAFDRFWRGRTDQSGSGLGLAIVRSIVEVSGGEVSLRDGAAGGLTVSIALPATGPSGS